MKTLIKLSDHPEIAALTEKKSRKEESLLFNIMKKKQEVDQLQDQILEVGRDYWDAVNKYIADKNIDPGSRVYWLNEDKKEIQEGDHDELMEIWSEKVKKGPDEKFKELEKQAKEAAGQEVH